MSGPPPDSDSAPAEEDYFAAVERHFVALRGSPAFITPKEWHLIFDWHRRSIPLRVVREALDQAFARLEKRRAAHPSRRPYRLSYCRQPVESAYRRFQEILVGSPEGAFPPTAEVREELRLYLVGLERVLRQTGEPLFERAPALGRLLVHSAARVRAAASQIENAARIAALEAELEALDADLLAAAESEVGEADCARLRQEAETEFAGYRERMPPAVYRSAVESAYLKKIRARFGLPRLSLSGW